VTGHAYVELSIAGTWQSAKQRAEATTYNGMKGHLVTITSQAELDLVATLFENNNVPHSFWTAGNDLVSMASSYCLVVYPHPYRSLQPQQTGAWRWQSGPETGRLFYTQDGWGSGRSSKLFLYDCVHKPHLQH